MNLADDVPNAGPLPDSYFRQAPSIEIRARSGCVGKIGVMGSPDRSCRSLADEGTQSFCCYSRNVRCSTSRLLLGSN